MAGSSNFVTYALLGGAAYLAWNWWKSQPSTAPVAPGVIPPVPVPSTTGGLTPSVKIANNTGSSSSIFRIADAFTVTVTGPANSPVTVSGTQNGVAFGPVPQGSTDASGVLIVKGTMPSQNVGSWAETWTVGDVNAGSISFTVSGGTTDQTNTPQALAALLNAAAGDAGKFGLNIDQWLYYYQKLPGRSVTGSQIDAMLANAGMNSSYTRATTADANWFVDELNSVGLSGHRSAVRIPVPPMYARGFGHLTLGDLRRAGGR